MWVLCTLLGLALRLVESRLSLTARCGQFCLRLFHRWAAKARTGTRNSATAIVIFSPTQVPGRGAWQHCSITMPSRPKARKSNTYQGYRPNQDPSLHPPHHIPFTSSPSPPFSGVDMDPSLPPAPSCTTTPPSPPSPPFPLFPLPTTALNVAMTEARPSHAGYIPTSRTETKIQMKETTIQPVKKDFEKT